MSVSTAAVGQEEKDVWMGGTSPMEVSYGKLMMWFFLLSDTLTFSALLVAYGTIRFANPIFEGDSDAYIFSQDYWPIPERVFEAYPGMHAMGVEAAPLIFVGIMTFILIMSSVTMVLAVEAGQRMDKADVIKWMLWTLLGGIAFLSCQAWEWGHFIVGTDAGSTLADGTKIFGANLIINQYGPPAFADFFFFITGFHGFHVFSGVIFNFIIFYWTVIGKLEKVGHYEMVEKVGLYWHFVDLVWVFVFTFFYLV